MAQPQPEIAVPPRGIGPISDPNKNDVLCGRGRLTNEHPGNTRFGDMISQNRSRYSSPSTKKLEKAHIAAEIVREIRAKDPSGRFLKQDSDNGAWYDIGDAKAIKKVGQALRATLLLETQDDGDQEPSKFFDSSVLGGPKAPPQPPSRKTESRAVHHHNNMSLQPDIAFARAWFPAPERTGYLSVKKEQGGDDDSQDALDTLSTIAVLSGHSGRDWKIITEPREPSQSAERKRQRRQIAGAAVVASFFDRSEDSILVDSSPANGSATSSLSETLVALDLAQPKVNEDGSRYPMSELSEKLVVLDLAEQKVAAVSPREWIFDTYCIE